MPARTWHNRWYSRSAACLLAALLLNALTLAPARHRDGDGADHEHCAICLLLAGPGWTASSTPALAPPARWADYEFPAPATVALPPPTPQMLVRGPPLAT